MASRCDRKARKYITPRLRDESNSKYNDLTDILEYLKIIYNNPNRVYTAKRKFRSLYIKATKNFYNFLSKFLYLTAELGIAKDNWKDKLHVKLTTEL